MFRKGRRPLGQESAPSSSFDTVVGAGSRVEGDITIRGDAKILGQVEGSVSVTGAVEIELGATIQGDLRAERALIGGKIVGDIYVQDSLELKSGSHLRGDVFAKSFRIQDGAVFQGQCHMGRDIPAGAGAQITPTGSR